MSSVASLMSGRGTVRGCLSSISSAVQQGRVSLAKVYSCHGCRGDTSVFQYAEAAISPFGAYPPGTPLITWTDFLATLPGTSTLEANLALGMQLSASQLTWMGAAHTPAAVHVDGGRPGENDNTSADNYCGQHTEGGHCCGRGGCREQESGSCTAAGTQPIYMGWVTPLRSGTSLVTTSHRKVLLPRACLHALSAGKGEKRGCNSATESVTGPA